MYTSKNDSLNIKQKSKSKNRNAFNLIIIRVFNLQNIFWQNKRGIWFRTVSKTFFFLLMYVIKGLGDLLRKM